ncbi:MAG: PAS domain S-box protein [Candidatus Omnitrophica bacterium]|nr:PAS domain S-box protein [Candidatus Omnitrophota bacterium]
MDYVFFCYGASFIFLGAVCLAILRRSPDAKRLPWFWLGLFGFVHGLNEWMDMVAVSLGDSFYLRTVRLVVMIASFVCLMEFGRRGYSEASGRRISAGFYVLFFVAASLGLLSGWEGINAASRYCFGLVSGVWAAYIFLSFKSDKAAAPLNRFSVNLLRIAGISLLLYGLTTGLIVPHAKFFPANIINTGSFIDLIHLPVQLFRGIFAFILSAAVALYAINQGLEAFLRHGRVKEKRLIIFSIFSFAGALVLFFLGWMFIDGYGRRIAEEERDTRYLKAKVFVQFVHAAIGKLETMESLANAPYISDFLVDISNRQKNIEIVNDVLDRYKTALKAEVCYLMDASGSTVASSNRDSEDSFVGKNYAFRPYFQQAIQGNRGLYLAYGITTNKRGIYVSYPVFDQAQRSIVGVAVAKAAIYDIEQFFRTYNYVFLVSPDGLIFVSSRPELIFKSFKDLSGREKERLVESRQFGEGPWDNAGFRERDDLAGTILYQGKQFFFAPYDVKELPGWKIYVLDDRSTVPIMRFALIVVFISFLLVIAVIAMFIFKLSQDMVHLLSSEVLYETLVESLSDSVQLFNREGRCVSINNSGLRMTGRKKEDAMGSLFEDFWPSEYSDKMRKVIQGVLEGNQQNLEGQMAKSDGSIIIKSVTLTPIFEDAGEIRYFICVARDITEDHRSRDRLTQSSKIATVGALATGVSHEFNNVLEIILGNAEMAYVSKDPEAMKQALKIIIDSARRAAWIVKSMLDFSGKASESREFIDIVELIKQNLVLLNKVFEVNGIMVETHFKEAPRVYCNPGKISQAFVNIMINARDAMRGLDEKRLVISVEHVADPAEVVISFKDSGCGISEDIKSRLFGPFVTTKGILGGGEEKQPGVGLGLFVAYGIVKQHNGNITVESKEGEGAKFTIFLPIFSGEEKPARKETV